MYQAPVNNTAAYLSLRSSSPGGFVGTEGIAPLLAEELVAVFLVHAFDLIKRGKRGITLILSPPSPRIRRDAPVDRKFKIRSLFPFFLHYGPGKYS